jgi:DNA-directed RNA polymerase subunit H
MLFKSRKTVLEILKTQDYNVSVYENFSINEINSMYINNQLDMLINHNNIKTKIYVRFNLVKIKLNDIVDDVFNDSVDNDNAIIPSMLNTTDTLFIISNNEINDSNKLQLKQYWEEKNIFISYVYIKRLLFNPLNHELVPIHKIIREEYIIDSIKQTYNIKHDSEFPNIDRFDPIATVICLRPGELCQIIRKSKTALSTNYYRLCV